MIGGNGKIVELEPPGKIEMCLFALKGKGECELNRRGINRSLVVFLILGLLKIFLTFHIDQTRPLM
jgi:hypothetical protein